MSRQVFRLPAGGRIDRLKPVSFTFNGRTIDAYEGDTVASALLANGVRLVGRSFKYHRPRGVMSHGSDEPNALLDVDGGPGRRDPNNRATVIDATSGLRVTTQNHWPSVGFDLGAVNDWLSPVFVAGFYYKTFKWPRAFWDRFYEPAIRAAAGLGRSPEGKDADRYAHSYAHCEILVIGGGPAGLAAASAAARSGKRVILADEQAEFGGALLHDRTSTIDGITADAWVARTVAELRSTGNVRMLQRTTAFGYYNQNMVALVERHADPAGARETLWQVRATQVVLAGGAHERPLPFADNDRPGIMLAESVRAYLNRYGVAPGRNIVLVTTGASAYQAALDAKAAGLSVTIVDLRQEAACGSELEAARVAGIPVLLSHTVVATQGRKAVNAITVAPVDANGQVGARQTLSCDCVGMSGGWTPAVHLFSQSRGKLRFDEAIDAFVPGGSVQSERSAGAARGLYELVSCLSSGWAAGCAAAGLTEARIFDVAPPTPVGLRPARSLPTDRKPSRLRCFIDMQNDVTERDIRLAVREGFESVEHVKRYTTTGMATDQGKTSNMVTLGLLSTILNKPVQEVGTTTFRPPFTPVFFGALVGLARDNLFVPERHAPLHDWATRQNAVFEGVELWKRARYFPRGDEDMHAAVSRECRAVRTGVGIFDASTLGKIEIVGPDAAEFLNRIYTSAWHRLEPGRCRYGLLLKEDGYVYDDGVIARLASDRFHATTTTGRAGGVLTHMEDYLQTEWPDLRVYLTSITEQWAVIALQGPRARDVIAPHVAGVDLSPDVFPHMAVRLGRICDVPMRLFRVSFTGELGFEINVASGDAPKIWDALMKTGAAFGITPYGTEAMHVLRAERGFIIVGQETDGTVTPDDLGLSGMIAKSKKDFVGKRSLDRPAMREQGRKQLVGLAPNDPKFVLDEGAQIVADPSQRIPMKMLGHVTSSYWSDAAGRSIALALVSGGRQRKGQTLHVTTLQGFAPVTVVDPVFFDAGGKRVEGEPAHA